MDNRDAQYWSNNNRNNNNRTGMRNFDHFSHNVLGVVGAVLTVEFIVPVVINGIRAIASMWSNSSGSDDMSPRRDVGGHDRNGRGHQRR